MNFKKYSIALLIILGYLNPVKALTPVDMATSEKLMNQYITEMNKNADDIDAIDEIYNLALLQLDKFKSEKFVYTKYQNALDQTYLKLQNQLLKKPVEKIALHENFMKLLNITENSNPDEIKKAINKVDDDEYQLSLGIDALQVEMTKRINDLNQQEIFLKEKISNESKEKIEQVEQIKGALTSEETEALSQYERINNYLSQLGKMFIENTVIGAGWFSKGTEVKKTLEQRFELWALEVAKKYREYQEYKAAYLKIPLRENSYKNAFLDLIPSKEVTDNTL